MIKYLLLFFMFSTTAYADDRIHTANERAMTAVSGGDFTSTEGETLDTFVLRIQRRAVALSKALRSEVCGEFRGSEGNYRLTLYTTKQEQACRYPRDGQASLSFHTHIDRFSTGFSPQDYVQAGYLAYDGRTVLFQNGVGTSRRLVASR